MEAVTWSFVPHAEAELFGGGGADLVLANPIASSCRTCDRASWPGLLRAAQRNADRGYPDAALFEVGQCFGSDEPEGQTIRAAASGVVAVPWPAPGDTGTGPPGPSTPSTPRPTPSRCWAASGGADRRPPESRPAARPGLHPGRSGTCASGRRPRSAGSAEVHPRILQALDLKGSLVAFEIVLDALPLPKHKPTKAKPALTLSEFQPLSPRFAFVVGRDVPAGDLVKAAQGAERKLVTGVDVFDLYEGPGVPRGAKSVAIAVRLQPVERT